MTAPLPIASSSALVLRFGLACLVAPSLAACGGTKKVIDTSDMSVPRDLSGMIFQPDDFSGQDFAVPPDMAQVIVCPPEDLRVVPTDAGIPKGKTGAPCTAPQECLPGKSMGQPARCVTQSTEFGQTVNWPNGYCSTLCDPDLNNVMQFGLNPDCPGNNATCVGNIPNAHCVVLCSSPMNCRPCYSCFQTENTSAHGCLPLAASQCDPAKTDGCPFAANGMRMTCEDVGYGDVGKCDAPCDPFTGKGCPGGAAGRDCHASDITGIGFCTKASLTGFMAGDECMGFPANECPSGYGCLNNHCWKYCKDDNRNVQCTQGARCLPLTQAYSPSSVIGICEMSK